MTRQAAMTNSELRAIIDEVYGNGGQRQLAADMERSEVTICRWATGRMPIGSVEATLLRLLLVLHRKGLNWHKWLIDYKKNPSGNAPMPESIEELL